MTLHCSNKIAFCTAIVRYIVIKQCRPVSSSCQLLTNRHYKKRLNWSILSPDKSFSIDEAVEKVANADSDAAEGDSPRQSTKSETPADPLLSLTRDDLQFVRSRLSPLRPPAGEAEEAAATTTTVEDSTSPTSPSACPHWGVVADGMRACGASQRPDCPTSTSSSTSTLTPTYAACDRWEAARLLMRPAFNPWQEQIQLTLEGKLWHFPIDNEQGRQLEEEGELGFESHVLVERHARDWLPKTGPIRHFMETVCCGLAQNAFMTAREKREHLDWFRDYFADKRSLIQAVYDESLRPKAQA